MEKAKKQPTIADCHWRTRIGDFIGSGQDVWWILNESANLMLLTQEIETLLAAYALPFINQLISNEQLESLWRAKLANQLDFRAKINLAILLKNQIN